MGPINTNTNSDSKERILKSAEDVFAEKGLAGARVNEIANRAGVNKRMLYHYFGNKEELYEAVLKANMKKIYSIQDILSSPDDVVKQVEQGIRKHFYFLAENPNFVRLMEWESLQGSAHLRRVFAQYNTYNLPAVQELVERGVKEGIFHPDVDSRHLVLSINAMCFLYFSRAAALGSVWDKDMLAPEALEERLRHILQVVFRTILREPEGCV